MEKERSVNLDLIRTIAIACVIMVHSLLKVGFYSTIEIGKKMYIMTVIRTILMICVPLFMTLTGYLMNQKKLNKEYYRKIGGVIFTYIIASILCIIYKKFYLGEEYTLKTAIFSILDFSGDNYSWYIEMYLGLYLLIPFLNIIWNNLENKKQSKILIITLISLTILPTLFNTYNLKDISWFAYPAGSTSYTKLVPSWWTKIYPITYYFIGAYFSKYKVNLSIKKNLILLFFGIVLFGSYNFYRSYGHTFVAGTWVDYGGFETLINTILVFILCINMNLDNIPNYIKKTITAISKLSLGMYLTSYIFDDLFYGILNRNISSTLDKFKYIILVVFAVFCCSMLLSSAIKILQILYNKLINIIKKYKLRCME